MNNEHNTCPDCGHRLPHPKDGCQSPYWAVQGSTFGCTYGQAERKARAQGYDNPWETVNVYTHDEIEAMRKRHYAQGSGEHD